MLKSVCVAFDFAVPELTDPGYSYATELAQRHAAHLTTIIGVPEYLAVPMGPDMSAAAILAEFDQTNLRRANDLASRVAQSRMGDAAVRVEVVQGVTETVSDRAAKAARLSDVAVLTHPEGGTAFERSLARDVLFASGAPVILVPRRWTQGADPRRALVAWDGSAKAARAVRDALPFLRAAEHVEVVSVSGEKDLSDAIPGADLAASLSRHCRSVGVVTIPVGGAVSRTLLDHAGMTRAELVVMGAYAHSRIRELVFGGVTRDMLAESSRPVLLSF